MHIESTAVPSSKPYRRNGSKIKYASIIPDDSSENQNTDTSSSIPVKRGRKTNKCAIM